MNKSVLLIAYHFPPVRVSSGIQRTLKFCRYLPQLGWKPLVLTVHPRAYAAVSDDQLNEIPNEVVVRRAFALDTARHLSIAGRYPDAMALPDRWVSWWLGGVWSGLRMIRKYRPEVLWSTYPVASAHLIGLTLHRISGIPWVADFRDSMTEEDYPQQRGRRRVFRWIERQAVTRCSRAVFTTPGTIRMYAERYPHIPADRWVQIANGFDEENFRAAEQGLDPSPSARGPAILLHSGVIYPTERDPTAFFNALADLKQAGRVSADSLQVVLRASGHEDLYQLLLDELGIADLVTLAPVLPYKAALQEMIGADGLLIFQASNCNHQIPAKIYEYLRARRPILALTDPAGDTAGLLKEAGIDTCVALDDKDAIAAGLLSFLRQVREGSAPLATESVIYRYTRQAGSTQLAALLDEVAQLQASIDTD